MMHTNRIKFKVTGHIISVYLKIKESQRGKKVAGKYRKFQKTIHFGVLCPKSLGTFV